MQHSNGALEGHQPRRRADGDTDRFREFYDNVFGATHEVFQERDRFKLTVVWVGPTAELNVFELAGNTEHERQVPMFGRGRLDHLALEPVGRSLRRNPQPAFSLVARPTGSWRTSATS